MTNNNNIEIFFNRKRGRPPKNRVVEVFKNRSSQAIFSSFKLDKTTTKGELYRNEVVLKKANETIDEEEEEIERKKRKTVNETSCQVTEALDLSLSNHQLVKKCEQKRKSKKIHEEYRNVVRSNGTYFPKMETSISTARTSTTFGEPIKEEVLATNWNFWAACFYQLMQQQNCNK